MRFLRYLPGFLIPALVAFSLFADGAWSFLAVVVLFGGFPLLELFTQGTVENLHESEERSVWQDRTYAWLLYAMLPIQVALLATYIWRVHTDAFTGAEWVGATFAMGIGCGVLGINVGHDLGHRRKKSEQRMAKALLMTSLYGHFFIEHNRGHHARVATDADPASARYGESLYRYLPRSLFGGWLSAWELEKDRLTRRGEAVWSWRNEMLRLQLLQLAAVVSVGVLLSPHALAGFLVVAMLGALLLETVNYVEHYGLAREQRADGTYGRVLPIHSWNSNHPIGRTVLFELTRHSDHHANARRPYQVLRHFDEAPQLPTGYPGMVVLAWFSPIWFAVMHRHIERLRANGNQGVVRAPNGSAMATT